MFTPRRLFLLAGLATSALLGCSNAPATKSTDSTPAASPPPAAPQPPAAQAQAAPPPPPRPGQPAIRVQDPTAWNGTPPDQAGKPGSYIVLSGKVAPVPADVKVGDKPTIDRILDEGKNRNHVMDHITHLTTKIGPRLTGSTNVDTANHWALEQFKSWGLDASLFQWGEIPVRFDRLPSTAKIGTSRDNGDFRILREMEFTSLAWGAGTDGPVRGKVFKMPETEEQFKAIEDKLKGSWILIKAVGPGGRRGVGGFAGGMTARQGFFAETRRKMSGAPSEPKAPPVPQPPHSIYGSWDGTATGGPFAADGTPFALEVTLNVDNSVSGSVIINERQPRPFQGAKWDEASKELTFSLENASGSIPYSFTLDGDTITGDSKLPPEVGGAIAVKAKRGPKSKSDSPDSGPSLEEQVFTAGPAGYISSSSDDRVRTSSIGGWNKLTPESLPKDVEIQVRQSDYDYMNSRLADGGNVEVEINSAVKFTPGPVPVYDTVAEIKGTEWPDEVVIISGHLDSWNGPGSQGAIDNGTGASVTLEAARILAAAHVKPKRTIRFILWTGEEQGLLGSKAYVKDLKDHDQLKNVSACFVDDGGTNWEGGLHCLNSQTSLLAAATAPVNGVFWSPTDRVYMDVNIRPGLRAGGGMSGGDSDHSSFNHEHVPGFFWDEIGRADYFYGWHTQNDKLELAIPEYLVQSSTCAAITAYNLACAPTLLPREPLPQKDEKKPDQSASAAK